MKKSNWYSCNEEIIEKVKEKENGKRRASTANEEREKELS